MPFIKGHPYGQRIKKGQHLSIKTEFLKGMIPWNKGKVIRIKRNCIICNKEFFNKPSQIKARPNWYKCCSDECSRIYRRGKPIIKNKGKNNPSWKGGITPIHTAIRNSFEYEDWRKSVFEKDLYTCQECGKIGGMLHADHIKPFALYPDLRFDINNGRTLCIYCHRKTNTYGGRIWQTQEL